MKIQKKKKNSFEQYSNWLKRKNLAHRTIINYLQEAKLYQEKELNTVNLQNYVKKNLEKYEASTWQTKINCLMVYARRQQIKINWEKIKRLVPKFQQKYFPTIDCEELEQLKKARFEPNDEIYERNNLILDFLFYTGIRREELRNIRFSDWKNDNLKIHGKGNKIRYIFLPEFLIDRLINPYSKIFLFTTRLGRILPQAWINKIIDNRAKLTGIKKKITPHAFRRSFATLLHNKGTQLTTIQKLLGHSKVEITAGYIHNNQDYLFQDYSKLWK